MNRLLVGGLTVVAMLVLFDTAGTAQSTDFFFAVPGSRVVPVELSDGPDGALQMVWPDLAAGTWDTALLHVGVGTGETDRPFLEIEAGGARNRQYFRSDEEGARWVNLGFLADVVSPGMPVTIRPSGVRVGAGSTRVRAFSGRPDLSGRILVLAPHPDDAEIAAFGIYAGREATVVTITAGNAGSPTYEAVFDEDDQAELYAFKGRMRVIDSITVPWQGGIPPDRCFNLGYFDARLAAMYDAPSEIVPEMYGPNTDAGVYRRHNIGTLLPHDSRPSTWSNLVDDVAAVIDRVDPEVIVAPHPQLDTHRDHQFTTVALAAALARSDRDVALLLYTNHADRNRYPYGPAGTIVSLPTAPAAAVTLDRVYSHPLDEDTQRAKLFALESMHDLRYTPTRQYQLAVGDDRTLAPEAVGSRPDITYLRRGPRSNELFFVYDRASLGGVIEAFLERYAADR